MMQALKVIFYISILFVIMSCAHNKPAQVPVQFCENQKCAVTLLLPNSNMQDNSTRAGRAYQFPSVDSPIRLKAMFLTNYKGDSAEEKIKIIATRQKENLLPLGFREGVFQAYDAKSTGMISDLIRRLNQIELTDWTETTVVYTLKR